MKKETSDLTFKNVIEELKVSRYFFSPQLLYFSLCAIICLMIGYVFPLSLFISIPFVLVPSYFAFTTLNSLKGKKNSEHLGFFSMFKTYFSPLFFGGYRLIGGYFKALLVNIISSFIFGFIFFFAVATKVPEYSELMNIVNSSNAEAASEAIEAFSNTVLDNSSSSKLLLLFLSISTLLSAFTFIHHLMVHSIKMKRNLFVKQVIPVKQYNFVDRRVRKDNRNFLFKSYTRTCWFIQLLVVLAGASGIVISYFFLNDFTTDKCLIICLFLMFIVLIPFMNYINKVQDLLYFSLSNKYEETFATLTLEFLTQYKEKIGIAEEDAQKLEELLKMTQEENKINEDKKKEDDEVK